jgi:hypothetical protein
VSETKTPAAASAEPGPRGYVEYEIDIEKVLRSELPLFIEQVELAPLVAETVDAIPLGAKGAYVLYLDGLPVYAGKTDTRHGFRDRLNRHAYTIRNRRNLDPARIGFKAIRILVFSNFDVEAILIDAMRKADPTALAWNDSGFGSNDPGHNREGQRPADFDTLYPIDIDRLLSFVEPGDYDVLSLLIEIKRHLPFDLRYQTDPMPNSDRPASHRVGHQDHRAASPVTVAEGETTRSLLNKVMANLPDGWRTTLFPGRVILYKEDTVYTYALESFTAVE